jgi:hypothetical protein
VTFETCEVRSVQVLTSARLRSLVIAGVGHSASRRLSTRYCVIEREYHARDTIQRFLDKFW